MQELELEIPPDISKISPEEKARDVNGCGPRFWHNTHSFFAPACDIHDIEYSLPYATGSAHRKETDNRFLHNMLELTNELPWHKKILRKAQAYIFYGFVRVFGQFFYNRK